MAQKPYSLVDLKRIIDFTIEQMRDYEKPEDMPVLINVAESSMGTGASAAVVYAGEGMDWERGQFRLTPSRPLVSKGKALYDVKLPRSEQFDGRTYYFCDNCGGGGKVSKDDKYCRYYGQRLR